MFLSNTNINVIEINKINVVSTRSQKVVEQFLNQTNNESEPSYNLIENEMEILELNEKEEEN